MSLGSTISGDGRYVGFGSAATDLVNGDGNDTFDAFVRDRQTETTTRVSTNIIGLEANGASAGFGTNGPGNQCRWALRLVASLRHPTW